MQYDGLNYILTASEESLSDTDPENWVRRIPKNRIKFLPKHQEILEKVVNEINDEAPRIHLSENLSIENSASELTFSTRNILANNLSLQEESLALYTNKTVKELIDMSMGNCNYFSALAKEILEIANIRYHFGIQKIDILNNSSNNHTFLRLTLQN